MSSPLTSKWNISKYAVNLSVMTKYVLAISGGIDSVAMLDMIASNYGDIRRVKLGDAKWPDDFVGGTFRSRDTW